MNRRSFLLAAALLAGLAISPLRAAETKYVYVSPSAIDAIHLLPAPPARGSIEDKLDFDNTLAVHQAASPAEIARGHDQNKLTVFHYAPAIGDWFVPGKFPRTEALFNQVEAEAKGVTDDAKNVFRRPRPYHVAPDLFPHSIEHEDPTHYSYPSGHSTRGTVFALVLAELFPDKRDALIAQARETGWLRVQGGVHYPQDIFAGRVLGQALVRAFLASPAFQRDLAAARAEIAAAQPTGGAVAATH
ncbi:MAG TPA: phosphatase PAP2 family protein [Opitutaceae bacterium]|nr:phosphatase PAP2 family protein [Opitutaceae bacterium]